ncbi:pilin [Vibrio nigripulchritudo]|uniref:pilin n=1 Tax=Vibrio nigripulchritudo TaxID=28173 RepID=UPI0003B21701|nr:prepilin-type N-terminal cleavage/methylation domain-containing protein [Vibrio nigripulchritudo]CCN70665.1 Type IV pilin PilA [Vibrio nigripulchritudo SFn118]
MKNKKQQGFTLIELMIVVAIIGVLSAIAVPAYQDYVKKSEGASAMATLKSVLTPAELWYQEQGDFLASEKTQILGAMGIAADSNKLGTVEIKDNEIEFKFGSNSSVPANTTIDYVRSATGWGCTVSLKAIETDSCPVKATP